MVVASRHAGFKIVQFVLSFFIIFVLLSCEEDDNGIHTVNWKNSSTISSTTSQAILEVISVHGVGWKASIVEGNSWCSFSEINSNLHKIEGYVVSGVNEIVIYTKQNQSGLERKAVIEILFEGKGKQVQTFTLTQVQDFYIFTETPAVIENEYFRYITHYTELNNQTIRNYSICYDINKKAALWVAYPMHSIYLGNTKRTNKWSFDPAIEEKHQSNCVYRSYASYYDRGHQIASGDRTGSYHMNLQTFYMTNITPQLDRLNQDMWANLEAKVRTYTCSDTLFVVTGAYYESNNYETIRDGGGVAVPKPTHYYKVILRTKTGRTGKYIGDCEDRDLMSIGFWVEHKNHGNIDPPGYIIRSVADIEEKTGFDFFPLVSKEVKSQNKPEEWGL